MKSTAVLASKYIASRYSRSPFGVSLLETGFLLTDEVHGCLPKQRESRQSCHTIAFLVAYQLQVLRNEVASEADVGMELVMWMDQKQRNMMIEESDKPLHIKRSQGNTLFYDYTISNYAFPDSVFCNVLMGEVKGKVNPP